MGGRGASSKRGGGVADPGVKVDSDGDRFDASIAHEQTLQTPNGELKFPDSPSIASAKLMPDKGELELRSIHVPDKYQGKGDAQRMIRTLQNQAHAQGAKLTTTGVYSRAGKDLMNRLVARGAAREIANGRHEIFGL